MTRQRGDPVAILTLPASIPTVSTGIGGDRASNKPVERPAARFRSLAAAHWRR